MIIDHIDNAQKYYALGDGIRHALEYLKQTDFTTVEHGDYALDGGNVFVKVRRMQSRLPEEAQWEAHQKYADVHFLAEGQEKIGFSHAALMTHSSEYNKEKDICHLDGDGDLITLHPGFFIVFFPGEIHLPAITPSGHPREIKKVIVKFNGALQKQTA